MQHFKPLFFILLCLMYAPVHALPVYLTFEGEMSIGNTGMQTDAEWLSSVLGTQVEPYGPGGQSLYNSWTFLIDPETAEFSAPAMQYDAFSYIGGSVTDALYAQDSGPASRDRYNCISVCDDKTFHEDEWMYDVSHYWSSSTVMLEGFVTAQDMKVGDQLAIWEWYRDLDQIDNSHLLDNTAYSFATLTGISYDNPLSVPEPASILLLLMGLLTLGYRQTS